MKKRAIRIAITLYRFLFYVNFTEKWKYGIIIL